MMEHGHAQGGEADCGQAMQRLFELLDGELTPETERRLRSHITSCPDCFTEADFEQRFLDAIHAARAASKTPATCRSKVMAALRAAGFTG